MESVLSLVQDVAGDVVSTFARNWPFLAISVLAAAAIRVYVGPDRLEAMLGRRRWLAIAGAVALATLTPFCSCGTMAVLLGGLAARAPWAPLVAFMVASPLTSPSELVLSAGLFGWPFAVVFFVGTIAIGVGAGAVTAWIEDHGWLRNQARVAAEADCATPACAAEDRPIPVSFGPGAATATEVAVHRARPGVGDFLAEVANVGRRLLVFFFAFTAIGYLVIEAIPTAWIEANLGGSSPGAVLLAALGGIPAYVSTEGSLPLVAALMEGGMGTGAALAFLVTGAGTSIGAISGLLVIARRRIVALVVGILVVSAVALGWIGGAIL